MKNNRMRIALVLCLCVIAFGAWDKDKPASSTSLRSSNPLILANQSALETSFGTYHEFSTGGTNSGENLSIKFNAPITTPTHAANKLWIYGKDSAGSVIEAYILDESGNELQITSGGDLYSSAGLTVTSASTFNGSITLGAGDDLIGSSTSDITINTSKFTVAGATGNTVVAGTLDVTGNIDPTTYETTNGGFLDEDAMGSDSATKVCSQQSIKKYVDDLIAAEVTARSFGTWTNKDSGGSDDLVKDEVYKVGSDGFVCVYTPTADNETLTFLTDSANPPTTKIIDGQAGYTFIQVSVPVKKDDYWKIECSVTPIIHWLPIGTGTCTKQ